MSRAFMAIPKEPKKAERVTNKLPVTSKEALSIEIQKSKFTN
jgi:hypothetical protein